MKNVRMIARLDIKGSNLIKGVHLEGLRVIGNPQDFAINYYRQGADELIYMDVVASLYGRNNLSEIVEKTAENVFIPITVGGGVRSVEDAKMLLRCGADKIAINTAAVHNPYLISELAEKLGSQCVVLSVEAKSMPDGHWAVYTDNGRERTNLDVLEWCSRAVQLGVGEILLTSIDKEGTGNGFDYELIHSVCSSSSVPIIASGGMGNVEHLCRVIYEGADAVAMADVLHYGKLSIPLIKEAAQTTGSHIRKALLCA
jgi:cyclase